MKFLDSIKLYFLFIFVFFLKNRRLLEKEIQAKSRKIGKLKIN